MGQVGSAALDNPQPGENGPDETDPTRLVSLNTRAAIDAMEEADLLQQVAEFEDLFQITLGFALDNRPSLNLHI